MFVYMIWSFVEVHSNLEICLQVFLCWLVFFPPCSLLSHIQKVKLYFYIYFSGRKLRCQLPNFQRVVMKILAKLKSSYRIQFYVKMHFK